MLILCVPERMAVQRALEHAREARSQAMVLARTHSYEDRQILLEKGAQEAVLGEMELALELGRRALNRFGVGREAIERSLEETRRTLT